MLCYHRSSLQNSRMRSGIGAEEKVWDHSFVNLGGTPSLSKQPCTQIWVSRDSFSQLTALFCTNMQVLDCSWLWGREMECDMKLVLRTHTDPASAAQLLTAASCSGSRSRAPRSSLGSSPKYMYVASAAPPETAAFFYQEARSASASSSWFNYSRPLTLDELNIEGSDADHSDSSTGGSRSGAVCQLPSLRPWPALRVVEVSDEPMPQLMLVEQEHHVHAVIIASASAYFKHILTTAVAVSGVDSTSCAQPTLSGSLEGSSTGRTLCEVFKYSFVELIDPEQFHEAAAVLAFIYMHTLPSSSECTIHHLLNMIKARDLIFVFLTHSLQSSVRSANTLEIACHMIFIISTCVHLNFSLFAYPCAQAAV